MIIEGHTKFDINSDISILEQFNLSKIEATNLCKIINDIYDEWNDDENEYVYIKTNKKNLSGGTIEYIKNEQRVFVHLRGIVVDGKRINKNKRGQRGFCGMGSIGKISFSILLRANGTDKVAERLFIQKKAYNSNKIIKKCDTEKILKGAKIHELFRECPYIVRGEISTRGIIAEYMNLGDIWNFRESIRETKAVFPSSLYSQIIRSTLLALDFMHKLGYVHRDIKIDNILINNRDGKFEVKLTDFETCVKIGTTDEVAGSFFGIAPTRLKAILESDKNKKPCLAEDDIFSAGIAFYELAYEKIPDFANSQKKIAKKTLKYCLKKSIKDKFDVLNLKKILLLKKINNKIQELKFFNAQLSKNPPDHFNCFIAKLTNFDFNERLSAIEAFKQFDNFEKSLLNIINK